jgi:hypothetical protein
MTNTNESEPARAKTAVTTYARYAGFFFFVSVVAGGFGEGYAPSQLIDVGDAAKTVANLQAHDMLFRLSFAASLIEGLCDIALAVIFYVLLKPVSRGLALLAAMFGVASAILYGACELFYFALPHLLLAGGAALKGFTPEQIDGLVLLSLRLFSYGAGLFLIFYGTGWILRGWLIIRSGYIPKFLGALMIVGGLGFVARTLTIVLIPAWSSPVMLLLLLPGGILLGLWLLIRGVDSAQWHARLATAAA